MTNPYFISATFQTCFFSSFSSCNDEKNQSETRDNGNVQSHDQEKSKLNSTITPNSGAHSLRYEKIINSLFDKNNVTIINPFQDGLFWGCSWLGGEQNLSHISYNDETWQLIPYLQEIQKIYESRDTPLEFY